MFTKKIHSSKVVGMPTSIFDPKPQVVATFEDGTEKVLFDFYPDEISFKEGELNGMTEEEARLLYHEKDVSYLVS